MNKHFIILLLILFLSTIVFAIDPQIISIDYNQPYVNKPTTFTINFNPDTQESGTIRFVDNGYLITQKAFDETMNQLTFTYTWNVKEARDIKFYFVDINAIEDTNLLNNEWNQQINIKTGLDLMIDELTTTPQKFSLGQQIIFHAKIKNVGDENYYNEIPIDFLLNNVKVCTAYATLMSPDANCSYLFNDTNATTYEIIAVVNPNNTIPEFSITNNSKILEAVTIDRPDLFVNKIEVSKQIRRGSIINIGIVTKNLGGLHAENVPVNIYLTRLNSTYLIHQQIIPQILANNTQGMNITYVFDDVGDYTIKVVLDESNTISEVYENNNEFSYKITVVDFNLDSIVQENDALIKENGRLQGQINTCLTENSGFKTDIMNNETQLKSCQSNLNICNTNNATTISNWAKEYDSNQEAMIQMMRNENESISNEKIALTQEKDAEIKAIEYEKSLWEGLVVFGLIAYCGWLAYQEWLKKKPKGAVFTNA